MFPKNCVLLCIVALTGLTAFGQKKAPAKEALGFDEKLYNGIEWRSIGPFRGGRSAAATGVPGKPNLFYMGATGGGVWRTTDAGNSWENISDRSEEHTSELQSPC